VQRTYELTFVTKEESTFHTIVNATTLYLPDYRTRTFAFITDINKQKELEQTLIKQQHEINALNSDLTLRIEKEVRENQQKDRIMYQQARLATMGEMIGNIAHQWRQPLNIIALIMQDFYISGQLGTLNDEKLEKEYARANTVLQYMSSTIDDFRTFFKHSDEGEVFSINSAINSVIALVSKGLEHNNITIDVAADEEVAVFGYRNEFIQALINIINNAREAVIANADKGYIHIGVETDASNVYIEIKDNGGGIDDNAIDQIFEPYFTTKHKTQGTGLGLYMTHQIIVGNMNGTIIVENRGEGTSFTITLPKEQSV
jgi:signal transduction histidine kinase